MMRSRLQIRSHKPWGAFRTILVLLALLVLLGMLLGSSAYQAAAHDDGEQVKAYVLAYAQLSAQMDDMTASLISVAAVYLRYPLLVFLCGFSFLGVALIPLLCVLQGFSLAFSVSCFASALGQSGVRLAISAFGLRCLFVLPCTLAMAVWWIRLAAERRENRAERHKRDRTVYDSAYFFRVFNCLMILLVGIVLELWLVPKWFAQILSEWIQ